MKERTVPLVLAAAGAFLVVGILTFAGPCVHDDGSAATCAAAAHATLAAGAVALVVGIAAMIVRGVSAQMVLSAIGIVAGAFAIGASGVLFPLCMMQTMRCWTIMRPFSMAFGVIIAVVAVVMLVQALGRRRRARKALRRMAR